MTVLVTAASKHGGTADIAATIAETLRAEGMAAATVSPDEVNGLDGITALVIGSAVYAGRWLPDAAALVREIALEVGDRPVWLFSSGPIGEPLKPDGDPIDAPEMIRVVRARGHRVFGGRLDRQRLGFGERAICAALRVPDGDFRPWDDVRAWAREISAYLQGDDRDHAARAA